MFTVPIKMPVSSSASDATNKLIVSVAIFTVLLGTFVSASLELAQLVVAVAGAAAYLIFYKRLRPANRQAKKVVCDTYEKIPAGKPHRPPVRRSGGKQPVVQKMDLRQDSKMPVSAPSFKSQQLDEQINELLPRITPSSEAERVAEELAMAAKRAIQQIFPEVDVVGFASGDIVRGTAFGVAVPELDIVASASPQVLIEHLQDRLSKGGLSMAKLDARKLQKSAIRACTDQLVSDGGFKFRRSAFRGQEPKVTLMAPPALSRAEKAIPVDFSVNSVTPLYNAALLTECGHIDARAKALILLVKRWAKDRGVCHAAKGHLAPYAWTVLTVYFMQVGVKDSPLLPALQGFKQLSGLSSHCSSGSERVKGDKNWQPPPPSSAAAQMSVGDLFREFFHFYAYELNWRKEAASVRLGKRGPAGLDLPLHIVLHEDKSTEVGPSIEDPFEPKRNLGMSITTLGLTRMYEELRRADALLQQNASLSTVLEPWMPPERANGSSDGEGKEASG